MKGFDKWVVGLVVIWLSAGCIRESTFSAASPPNIVLIMADDLGYSDLGSHGNRLVETPRLDRLARESVQFHQFYVTPVCATTRAALLTGRHFLRTGVSHVHGGKDFLHLEEVTLAQTLKAAGYTTGMWGKWHSGKTPGYFPWERGFDEAFVARLYRYRDNTGLLNGEEHQTRDWVTEALTDFAVDFIKANRHRPFFAYLPYLTCHAPLEAPEPYVRKYLDKGLSENLSTLYGMVDHLDHHIGRLLDTLDVLGLSEETIVLFLSDNGPAIVNGVLTDEDRKIRYVNGLRGHKGNIWENGIRSPLFVRWKGRFSPATVHQLTDVTDIYPTLVELAGGIMEAGQPPLDGRSLIPCLQGEGADTVDKEIFLYANPGWPPTDQPWTPEGVKDEYRPWKYAGGDNLSYEKQIMGIRDEHYKLLFNPGPTDGSIEPDNSGYVLLDMKADPGEQYNVIQENPAQAEKMKTSLAAWHRSVFKDTHAFEMPVFQIGGKKYMAYPVLAYAPSIMSPGVQSAFNYIHCFDNEGDSAVYRIRVEETGTYQMEIRYRMEAGDARHFKLLLPGAAYSVELQAGSQTVHMMDIPLTAGFATFTLKNGSHDPQGELRLYEFIFHHQEKRDNTAS